MTEQEEQQVCYEHGLVEDGFCQCDPDWTGPYCERPRPVQSENAPADEDFDNFPVTVDCDDHDDLVYPGAPDAVDGKDNDCDGEVDEGY